MQEVVFVAAGQFYAIDVHIRLFLGLLNAWFMLMEVLS